jgi:putative ABC transport system permease protein
VTPEHRSHLSAVAESLVVAGGVLGGLLQDVRYSARLLRREWAHSLVAATTIALGIAATTTSFSVLWGVVLKSLPYPQSDRLVRVAETRDGRPARVPWVVSNGTFLAWSDRPATVEGLGGWRSLRMTLTLAGDAVRIDVAAVTPNLFSILRTRPTLGRAFTAEETTTAPQGGPVIISAGLWQNRFGGRPDVLGRTVRLDSQAYTVVGVMPRGFAFPNADVRAWIPFEVPTVVAAFGRRMALVSTLARLRPGASVEQAAAEGTARGRAAPANGAAAMALFGAEGPVAVRVVPAQTVLTAEVKPLLRILFWAAMLLLVTAIVNVANLQLVRATVRHRERAIRASVGATMECLGRQSLVDSTLISLAGGVLGLALAVAMVRMLPFVLPASLPRVAEVTIDWPVIEYAGAATLITALVCGLLPAWQTRRVNLVEVLSEEGASSAAGTGRTWTARVRTVASVFQVATACLLLVGSGLLGHSLLTLARSDRGYDPKGLLTAELPFGRHVPLVQQAQTIDALLARLVGVKGVTDVGIGNSLPFGRMGYSAGFTIQSRGDSGPNMQGQTFVAIVTPGYLSALRVRVVEGRSLADTDTAASSPVALVNRSFASTYLGHSALGARVPLFNDRGYESTIVGIVEDWQLQNDIDAGRPPQGFVPYAQLRPSYAHLLDTVTLVVRTTGDPPALAGTVRALVREHDPSLALDSVMPMEARMAASFANARALTILVAGFTLVALLIAGVVLFGVLSYSVAQRVREIGVRTALGASPRDIVRLLLGHALAITIGGTVVGLLAAALLGKAASGLLYGVSAHDPVSFATVPVVLALVAAVACVSPALRAARLDPIRALKGKR